jgi:hypothetical protein
MPSPRECLARRIGASLLGEDRWLCRVDSAFKRYEALLFPSSSAHKLDDIGDMDKEVVVTGLDVNVWGTNDTSLHLTTNESYTLTIAAGVATLAAPTVYGALHGIETFSQMLVAQPGGGYMVRVARFESGCVCVPSLS